MATPGAPSEMKPPVGITARDVIEHRLKRPMVTANSPKVATQVFEVVELMEHILLELNTLDILRAMQALRPMRDTVLGSSKIQKKIGLVPDLSSSFHIPTVPRGMKPTSRLHPVHQDFHGLRLLEFADTFVRVPAVQGQPWGLCQHIKGVAFTFESKASSSFLQKLGSRVQNMLACQPQMSDVGVWLRCGHCIWEAENLPEYMDKAWGWEGTITPRDGQYVTFGDLQRAAVRVRSEHRRTCVKPDAYSAADLRFWKEILDDD